MKLHKKLILGSGSRALALFANLIVGLYLMPFIVHTLGDRIYGYWALVATVIGYYGMLDLGIVSAVQYFVAKSIGEKKIINSNQIISTAFFAFLIFGVIMFFISILIACFSGIIIKDIYEANLFRIVIIIMGIGFSIGFPCRVFMGIVSANLRFDLISLVSTICLVLRTILILIFLKNGLGIVGLACVTVFTDLILNILYFIIARAIHDKFNLSWSFVSYQTFKRIFSYSFYRFVTKVGDQLRFYFHAPIVASFIGINAVTHYSIASRLILYFIDIMVSFFGLLAPFFSTLSGRKDEDGMKRVFLFSTKLSIIFSTFIGTLLVLYGKAFITAWMGEEYTDAYIPLVVLIIGILFDVSQFPSVSYLMGIAKHQILMYLILIEGIINLTLSLILVQYFNLIGVALGAAIAMIIFKLAVQPVYVCREVKISLTDYYFRVLGSIIIITSSAIVLPWIFIFRLLQPTSYFSIFFVCIIQVLLALPIVFLFSIAKEEKNMIIKTLPISEKYRNKLNNLLHIV